VKGGKRLDHGHSSELAVVYDQDSGGHRCLALAVGRVEMVRRRPAQARNDSKP
jgi:hypothetical protein